MIHILCLFSYFHVCLLILTFIFSSYCGHIFLYSLYFHISMSSNIGFHIFLILWPHIAHSSGNMLLKVLQCCRFSIIMNLNGNLLPENCIADSSLPLSMDVNFGIIECCQAASWYISGKSAARRTMVKICAGLIFTLFAREHTISI